MTEQVKKMKWMEALKIFNASSGQPWIIPKKDTEAYMKVKKIQEEEKISVESVESVATLDEVVKKPRKKRVVKNLNQNILESDI